MSTVTTFHNNFGKENLTNSTNDSDTVQVQTISKQELIEDEHIRTQCLEHFRYWILQNKDIQNCITDDQFLLRFLRTKKFSLYMAQQMLLKYLNLRKRFKHIFYNLDYEEPNVYAILTSGYIFASPFRDRHGRRVIIVTGRKFDTQFNSTDMARAHIITYETLIDDAENQILGFTHVGDCEGASPSILGKWNVSEFITLARWGQESIPMKHKEIHVMNIPTPLLYVYDFVCSLGSKKLQDRTKVYNRLQQLHGNIDSYVLPYEYGGKTPMSEMVNLWKKELADKKERLLSLDKINLLSDEGIVRRNSKRFLSDSGSVVGSFRKLQID